MSFISEFKTFALRGNAIDLAVAVVLGAAFNNVVSALVDGVIMPILGLVLGGINLSKETIKINGTVFKWGLFLQAAIDFVLVALVIFLMVKMINTLTKSDKKQKEKEVSPEVQVLREIRDQLQRSR